jgi:transcription antitermination factor NusG
MREVEMAALCETTDIFPHDLLETAGDDRSDRRWWAVYTKSRQEKVFCQQLTGHQIPHYLPLVTKVSRSRGRRFSAQVPLFSGYVFMHGSEEERYVSLTTNRVSQILPVPDGAKLCFDLRQIARLIAAGAPLTVEERLAPGRRVRIRQGVFAGLEGTIIERRGGRRLFVAVDFLQQGASIDLEDFVLEAID